MLSSKLLPEMEAEEATMKEQILSGISSLPVHAQNEKIQVRSSLEDRIFFSQNFHCFSLLLTLSSIVYKQIIIT
jgi:hypothetical protein